MGKIISVNRFRGNGQGVWMNDVIKTNTVSVFVSPTCQVIIRPPSQLTRLAGKFILDIFVILACGANPAAAHLTLPNHLHAEKQHTVYNMPKKAW